MLCSELFEAPISDIYLHGSTDSSYNPRPNAPFDAGTSFSKTDQKILQSDKARTKMLRAFSKTPFDFQVYFINNKAIDGDKIKHNNERVDSFSISIGAGIYDSYHDIVGEPKKIKVVVLTNLSDVKAKMPMNAWTLAHKIGHSLQDHLYSSFADITSDNFTKKIKQIIYQCKLIMHRNKDYEKKPKKTVDKLYPFVIDDLKDKMTVKSARDGKLNNDFEVFAEMIAQYLITGSVKLNVDTEAAKKALNNLNVLIGELFTMLEGHVMLE